MHEMSPNLSVLALYWDFILNEYVEKGYKHTEHAEISLTKEYIYLISGK